MPPHPSVAAVRRAVRAAVAGRDGPLVVACSGGPDSVALAAATAFVADRTGLSAALVTVDHGLQPASADQARAVAALGYELGFDPVESIAVDTRGPGGPEAAARAARYAALDGFTRTLGGWLLLGHTLDDQAETVLLGLGRGSGPTSVAGMRPVDGHRLRPLLGLRRATTVEACAALGLPSWDDPHNHDPRYQRARVRHEVLPLLEDVLQGGVAPALARTAAQLQDLLDALAEGEQPPPGPGPLELAGLPELPAARRHRVLRAWALAGGAHEVTAIHVAALDALVLDWHGQAGTDLPGGLRAVRRSGRLELAATTPPRPPADRQD